MAAKKPNPVTARKAATITRKPTNLKKTAPVPVNLRKPKTKAGPKVKQIFVGKVMVLAGEFPDESHEKISGWITAHGGQRDREVTDDTTHLICTIEEYKKKTAAGEILLLPILLCSEKDQETQLIYLKSEELGLYQQSAARSWLSTGYMLVLTLRTRDTDQKKDIHLIASLPESRRGKHNMKPCGRSLQKGRRHPSNYVTIVCLAQKISSEDD